MEIVRCRSCRRETYAGLASCPHCGVSFAAAVESLHEDIAKALEDSGFAKSSFESELRQRIDSVLVTSETSPPDLAITKRCGVVVSNVPQRDQTQAAEARGSELEGGLSLDDMYNVALFDLRYQALRLEANAVIALTMAFAPRVKRFDTDLSLSLMGTAVYIEGLREEAEA